VHLQVQRLRSACEWLLRRATGRVERLELRLDFAELPEQQECSTHVAAAIAVCGAAGSLQQLRLKVDQVSAVASWLLAARSLQSLSVDAGVAFQVDSPLHALTALEELWLDSGENLCIRPGARLPPSLTRLHLGREESVSLPHQVRWHAACHLL